MIVQTRPRATGNCPGCLLEVVDVDVVANQEQSRGEPGAFVLEHSLADGLAKLAGIEAQVSKLFGVYREEDPSRVGFERRKCVDYWEVVLLANVQYLGHHQGSERVLEV